MRSLLLVAVVSLLAGGCVAIPTLSVQTTTTPEPESDRTDCGAILGTAFRSSEEQAWFWQNCSAWSQTTLGPVSVEPASQPQAAPMPAGTPTTQPGPTPVARQLSQADLARCNGMRGRPYANTADRDWFLQNCVQVEQARPGEPAECAQIRGRPYQSEEQRRWFLQNCTGPSAPADPDPGGPDRQNCDQIRGTPYRSETERDWFRQNCRS
jgi:hypothetical protein